MQSVKTILPGAITASLIAACTWLGTSTLGFPVMAAAIIAGLFLFKLYEPEK